MTIPRLTLPRPGQSVRGWCLYLNDRWDGEVPQEEDEIGFVVYPDEASAYAALARELYRRLDFFDAGKWPGGSVETGWYPMAVSWYGDGRLIDSNASEHWPAVAFR